MRTQITDVHHVGDYIVVKGTVEGTPISVDLPNTYLGKMERDRGRQYMERCLEKVYYATVVESKR